MTSFAIHHGVMPMYTGEMGTAENVQFLVDANFCQQTVSENKMSPGKYGKIQDGLESSISIDGRARITRIINDVKQMTDVEKLLLYLKLPTGGLSEDHQRLTPPSCLQASNRAEQAQALTWIKSHLEEHSDICLPKQEVYDDYKTYCENHSLRPLCNPDFGKMMKYAFPEVIARRLGKRGQSKYFYGGLRKKVDVTPPVLPELQVQVKHTEDECKENNDLLLAAGQVVCEWAQKLLEQSFSGLRDLAEHLVGNLYVGSKSVAAFTVIAAMQESGNQNGKNSALFCATTTSAVDKHRETQLQLQRKLQEKKLMEEQRRKMNHVREENEQNLRTSSSLDRKTPMTPRTASRASSNMERKTPKIPSTPSPLPLQSPRKFQTSHSLSQSEEHVHPQALSQTKTDKCKKASMSEAEHVVAEPNAVNQEMAGNKVESSFEADKMDMVVLGDKVNITEENVFTFPKPVAESKDDSKTPEHCQMETEEVPSHVRRIDFGEVIVMPEENDERKNEKELKFSDAANNDNKRSEEKVSEKCENNDSDSEMRIEEANCSKTKQSRESGVLSQSAGHVNLKMLLERKDLNENNLNKSLGFASSRNTNLFSGQSSNLSRSAFVPFSQSRKEVSHQNSNLSSDTSSSIVSYKQTICSNSFESLPKSATITITPVININQGATNIIDPVNRPPDNIIHIQPGNTYHNKELSSSDKAIIVENNPPNGSSVIMSVSTGSDPSGDEVVNTNPAIVQSGSAAQDLKTLSYQISPGANKQIKTPRFTPIKPKSSPQKASSFTKTATDGPTYDKRPVSAILKEKREREKAEALAKIQASIKLPTIQSIPGLQFQQVTPALALNSGQVRNIAPLAGDMLKLQASGNLPAKDVVIFVNTSSAAPAVPAVMTSSLSQSFQQSVIVASGKEAALVTDELKTPGSENRMNKIEELKQAEEVNEFGTDRDHTPNIEDIIFSKEEENLKGTNVREHLDETYTDKSKIIHESMEVERYSERKSEESENVREDIFEDNLDNTELQTPAVKIAKLNVDSPFRPESACSLGRETPIKIMRTDDLSVVRPESACSLGRETPSGGRKRKSSGNTQQRNFKRLNSTGEVEDSENGCDFDLDSNLLAHQKTEIRVYNQRRTHSCTLELDKDRKHSGFSHHPKSFTLDSVAISLQSPDIKSLEREALIDAFPHTVCSIQPSKHSKQKSSIGISSESFRNALKLRKQQEYLNDRVNTFLMKENTVKESAVVNEHKTSAEKFNLVSEVVSSCAELKDGFKSKEITLNKDRDVELESGIPSDVADFINETIEKRQSANNSVMSESSVVNDDQMQERDIEHIDKVEEAGKLVTDSVKYLSMDIVNNAKGPAAVENRSQKQNSDQNQNDDHFTVPKVPPFNFRLRDNSVRFPSPDIYSSHQRCSSLPTFTSPVSLPLSPHGRPGLFQRSSSISPNVGQSPDREISNISQGALRRVEIRENHPISVNVHPNLNMTDEGTFVRPNSLPIRITHHDEKLSQTAPYLASIQHSLQKPRETPVDPRQAKQKDSPKEKPSICSSPVARGQLSREPSAERMIFTPFSDRGYHSIGSSPVLNSTPVSLSDAEAVTATRQALSVGVDVISHISQASLSPQANFGQLTGPGGSQVVNINQLNTSTTSAFIPIQGSSNEIRYVTPIRPMATVAIEKMDGTVLNPNGQNQEIQNTLLCTSNRIQDPPSYEFAVRQKQMESTNTLEMVTDNVGASDKLNIEHEAVPNSSERISLLATMGQRSDQNIMKQMGPCASRLAQLSRQSKQGADPKPSNSHPSLMSALSEPAKTVGPFFLNEQSSLSINSPEKVPQVIHMTEKNSVANPSSYNDNDLLNVSEQNFDISDMTLESVRQTDIHTLNSNQLYRENKIMSSFGNVHSSNMRHQSGEVEIGLQTKVFDPSIGMISSENVLHSSPNLKLVPPIPQKMLSNACQKHSNFSYSAGPNIRPDDPYQDMTRQEFNDVDPLGNTLEDLKEILSDKSVVGDNGFYSETDISGNEDGIGDLLFGDE